MTARRTSSPLSPIGRIANLLHVGCAPAPQVWVAAAVPAALEAFASVITPSFKQVVKQTTGSSWLHQAKAEMEEAAQEAGITAPEGLEVLFKLAEFVDIFAWYMFLADVATEFVVNWTSNIWMFSPCNPDEDAKTFTAILPFGGFSQAHDWVIGPAWLRWRDGETSVEASRITVPPHSTVSIGAWLKLIPFIGVPGTYSTRLINDTTGEVLNMSTSSVADQATGNHPLFWHHYSTTGDQAESFSLQVRLEDNPAMVEYIASDGNLTAFIHKGGSFD